MTYLPPASVEGREQLHLVMEAAPNAMLIANARGEIVLANSEATRAFGYSDEEFRTVLVDELVPASARHDHRHLRENYFAHPERRGMGVGRELYGVTRTGEEIPVEIGLSPILIDGERHVLVSIIDITERLRHEEASRIARRSELVQSILMTLPMSVIATDKDGWIVSTNPAAETLLGYAPGQLVGHSLADIDHVGRKRSADGAINWTAASESVERVYRRQDASTVPVSEEVVVLRDDNGEATGYLAVAYDITQRIQSRQRVEHMLRHDPLTDLPNRVELLERLEKILRRSRPGGTQVALLLLDLDHFKRVNDTLGHDVGDDLLQRMADRMSSWVRAGDIVARLGGDEFVIVLGGLAPSHDLSSRVAALMTLLQTPIEIRGYEVVLTASIGGVLYPRDGLTPATLLRHADIAMYRAKGSGRDGIHWFDDSMLGELNEKLALPNALRQALGDGELSVVYQPQYRLCDGALAGFEALARWESPTLGPVSPDRFIPVAEDSGLILALGEWVMRTACTDITVLEASLGVPLQLAVNVSPRQLRGRGWLDQITTTLAQTGVDPSRFSLEITEGMLVEDQRDVVEAMRALRDLGIKIVVDDFGRGYSSLAYLARFPVDKIKIDRSFVDPIGTDPEAAPLVDAMIAMAHALKMEIIAEGVETSDQEQYLRGHGCDQVQGFRYSPGVEIDVAMRMPLHLDGASA